MKIVAKIVEPEIAIDPGGNLRRQIYDSFRRAILQGRLPAGFRLPSSRILASSLGVSRNTVLAAYEELIADGLVNGKIGSGTRVEQTATIEILDPDAQVIRASGRSYRYTSRCCT